MKIDESYFKGTDTEDEIEQLEHTDIDVDYFKYPFVFMFSFETPKGIKRDPGMFVSSEKIFLEGLDDIHAIYKHTNRLVFFDSKLDVSHHLLKEEPIEKDGMLYAGSQYLLTSRQQNCTFYMGMEFNKTVFTPKDISSLLCSMFRAFYFSFGKTFGKLADGNVPRLEMSFNNNPLKTAYRQYFRQDTYNNMKNNPAKCVKEFIMALKIFNTDTSTKENAEMLDSYFEKFYEKLGVSAGQMEVARMMYKGPNIKVSADEDNHILYMEFPEDQTAHMNYGIFNMIKNGLHGLDNFRMDWKLRVKGKGNLELMIDDTNMEDVNAIFSEGHFKSINVEAGTTRLIFDKRGGTTMDFRWLNDLTDDAVVTIDKSSQRTSTNTLGRAKKRIVTFVFPDGHKEKVEQFDD